MGFARDPLIQAQVSGACARPEKTHLQHTCSSTAITYLQSGGAVTHRARHVRMPREDLYSTHASQPPPPACLEKTFHTRSNPPSCILPQNGGRCGSTDPGTYVRMP
eukprot:1158024-Pelagomonas_calceolata.AAC.3